MVDFAEDYFDVVVIVFVEQGVFDSIIGVVGNETEEGLKVVAIIIVNPYRCNAFIVGVA